MPDSAATFELIDDVRARRNAVLLSIAQGLYGMNAVAAITTAGLIGYTFADDKDLATLPVSSFVTGTACLTVPASLFMRRVGRRVGFVCGAGLGLVGAVVATAAIFAQSFWLFCLGMFLTGGYQAFAQYYRFAAADVASHAFKAKAISWVLLGGLASAVFGPMIVIWTKELFSPVLFAGCFAIAAVLSVCAMGVLVFIDIPNPPRRKAGNDARPMARILRQPQLIVAIFAGMVAYGLMNLVMTATPLAMVACGFTVDDAAWVIQWHAIAMFLPSFFTGHLIARFGKQTIIAVGMVLLALSGAFALAGLEFANFGVALVFLGLGWNFGFVGATAMVTDCYRPSERNKVQAVNDLCVFGMVACASFTSGKLLNDFGWDAVNLMLYPLVAICLVLIAWLAVARPKPMEA